MTHHFNGRNWVYIAQLAAGVDPAINSSVVVPAQETFLQMANAPTQNDFILDGVDNNVNNGRLRERRQLQCAASAGCTG